MTRFFFSKFKIFKTFFIQPPKFIPYTNFKHQKWKLHGGFVIVPLPYWTGRVSKQAASWFLPPPLVFLGLRKYFQKIANNRPLKKGDKEFKQNIHCTKVLIQFSSKWNFSLTFVLFSIWFDGIDRKIEKHLFYNTKVKGSVLKVEVVYIYIVFT